MELRVTGSEVWEMISTLQKINTVVRLVDPMTQKVLEPSDDADEDALCCNIWGRCDRCENCTSLRALRDHGIAYKMEIAHEKVFWVISRYLCVDGRPCILEIVNDVTGSFFLDSDQSDKLGEMIVSMNRQAVMDALTGVYNRRFLDEDFVPSLQCCHDKNLVVNVAMLDIDDFKKVNDLYGHIAGDMLLRDAAGYWRGRYDCRDKDQERVVVRYGGDEFLIVTIGQTPDQFRGEIADYYQQMRKVCYSHDGVQIPFTIAIGIASSTELGEDWEWNALLGHADRNMYLRKKNPVYPE